MLRPFFKPKPGCEASLEADDWEPDLEHGEFYGTSPGRTQTLTPKTHPHLQLDKTVISIDFVEPGDQVYCTFGIHSGCQRLRWITPGHCDLIHAVEAEHTGAEDSTVLYIPAVPLTAKRYDPHICSPSDLTHQNSTHLALSISKSNGSTSRPDDLLREF